MQGERRKADRRQIERRKQDQIKHWEKIERLSLDAIETIAHTIDAKDSYTNGHSIRVAEYSVEIARKMGWSGRQLRDLRSMALLHDIGKIGIPDHILNKPALLTDAEYSVIQTHTRIGADILKGIHTIENLSDGARYHHERYDGRGYMEGLKGEEIPVTARIIAIADAFDAMTSNRTYQRNLSDEAGVIEEIKKGRGTQFDPQITDVFIECLQQGIFDHMQQQEISEPQMKQSMDQEIGWGEESSRHAMYLQRFCSSAYLEQQVNESLRNGDYTNLILVELKEFHKWNETYGHRAADEKMFEMMEIIYDRLHEGELACRMRDNQFVIGLDYYNDTWERYEDMCLHAKERGLDIVCSFAKANASDYEFASLYQHAEQAVYHAKIAGLEYFIYEADENRMLTQPKMIQADVDAIKEHIHRNADQFAAGSSWILFTITTLKSSEYTMDSMDAALDTLRKAVRKVVMSDAVLIRYSTNQMVLQLNTSNREQIKFYLDDIVSAYMKVTQYEVFELNYQIILK